MKNFPLKDKRILITYGPTWIPIDDTRILSNISSGALGQTVARELAKTGAKITALEGPVAQPLRHPLITVKRFSYYDEFLKLIKTELKKNYDIVIHAAAVSDYKLKRPFQQKISSHLRRLTLELVPTKKIIYLIKKMSPKSCLVGFKLTSHLNKALAIKKTQYLFDKARCDLVVTNSVHNGKYFGYILNRQKQFLTKTTSRNAMAKNLLKALSKS